MCIRDRFTALAGMLLGAKRGMICCAAYVLIGLCGFPIFAGGGGPQYIFHPTFGMLIGFVLGTGLTGFLVERMRRPGFLKYAAAGYAGFLVIYILGIPYYLMIMNLYMGCLLYTSFDASMKSNVDRLQDKEKTGVFTGTYAINPLNGAKVPIWLSDYVLADYGTGAIMCVPAHDDRDFEFAKKFDIPIIQVIAKDGKEIENMTEAYTEASGTMINSGEWNGMESAVLKKEAPVMIEKMGIGRKTVNYKLRDWVFSRQRYWGEPIPIRCV